jgi:hypothetical protein
MLRSRLLAFALALAIAGALGAAASSREAERAKCVSTPVTGQPGTAIVTCARTRR